jgi:PAS domain S-box-containing protein
MKGTSGINQKLFKETVALKKRIQELERSELIYKQAKETLHDSEERYRNFIANASEGIFRIDLVPPVNIDKPYDLLSKQIEQCAVIGEVNTALAGMYGLRPEQMIGCHIVEFAPNCGIRMADLAKSYDYRITEREEMGVSADGHPIYIIESCRGVVEDRMLKRLWGVQRNITDRKLAEKELSVSRNRLSRAEIISHSGNWEFDLESQCVFASDGARRIYGLLDAEWTISEVQKIPLPEYRNVLNKVLQDLIKENRPYDVEFKIQRPDTGKIVDIHSVAEYDYNRNVVFGIIQDITEQKQAESQRQIALEALGKSESLMRAITDSAQDAILMMDPMGCISFWNPGAEHIFGYTSKEAIGQNLHQFIAPKRYLEMFHASFSRFKKTGRGGAIDNTIELQACRKNGEEFPIELSLSAIHLEKGWCAVGIIRDITARIQAEEERQKLRERLKYADKMEAIGTLAGGIAHDFNNLLMGIQGYASLTLLDLDPSSPHYERLKRIEEQVRSGADLTKQLLGFARGGRYEVKPTDMNDILKNTSSMFGRTKKEISIHQKYGKDLRTVEVDQGQMEQVFMNLYVNAWQAMPGGGTIYLETENIILNDKQVFSYSIKPGEYIKISITDTGTGMDDKTRERIFDPFFTTKEMGRGTGLGLATVYGIIKGHGGIINVQSNPGHGTTFNIYLPASEKEVIKATKAAETIVMGTETILLVDDENMVLEVSRALLESIGYRVYTAGSGEEAINVYMEKENEINMVLLDMIMPGISGGETFRHLKEINPDIKVVLSSGYSINDQAQEILDRGCRGFLQKPFSIETLSIKIREILG